jgi:glycosyltransferase involved in cell wall biosynthesis
VVPLRRVALNALFLDPGASGGPETYARGLVPALAREFPSTAFTIVTTRAGARALRESGWAEAVEVRPLPCDEGQRGRRTLAEQLRLPALARRDRFDVLHSLASLAPIRSTVPSVITLHDVTFFHLRTFGAVTTFGMRQVVARAARRADAVIAVTAAARDDVARTLGLDTAAIPVVHHGVDPPAAARADPERVRVRYALGGGPIVLSVAAKRPHKNQELLVRALAHLPDEVQLVLAGHPEPYDMQLKRLAREIGVEPRVRFVDYVPQDELEALWQVAAVAAFPTRAEGFGIPVVEALARGVPVVCSDLPVLREVSGGHARTFDPDDVAGAAAAVAAAVANRADADAGKAWARRFSWAEAARATYEVYERVACTSG